MKASEWKRLTAGLDERGWVRTGRYIFKTPVGWVLHGLIWEDSSARPRFYLWKVRAALYEAPFPALILSYSERIGGGTRLWDLDDPITLKAIEQGAREVEDAWATNDELILAERPQNKYADKLELYAYGQLVQGQVLKATEALAGVMKGEGAEVDWHFEMIERAASMKALLEAGRVDEAVDRLKEWRRGHLEVVKLDPDAVSVEGL